MSPGALGPSRPTPFLWDQCQAFPACDSRTSGKDSHDDVIQWTHFPRYWPFRGLHRSPQRPATRTFDVFFDLRLNKRLSKHWWGWWFETPSCSLWHHCNEISLQRHKRHVVSNQLGVDGLYGSLSFRHTMKNINLRITGSLWGESIRIHRTKGNLWERVFFVSLYVTIEAWRNWLQFCPGLFKWASIWQSIDVVNSDLGNVLQNTFFSMKMTLIMSAKRVSQDALYVCIKAGRS